MPWLDSDTSHALLAIVGMTLVTVVCRSFFLWSDEDRPLPTLLQRGLRFAPLAALVAVIAPELLLVRGQWPSTLLDARWPAAVVAMGWYFWRRGLLGTIVSGMAVYLPLHLGLGW